MKLSEMNAINSEILKVKADIPQDESENAVVQETPSEAEGVKKSRKKKKEEDI